MGVGRFRIMCPDFITDLVSGGHRGMSSGNVPTLCRRNSKTDEKNLSDVVGDKQGDVSGRKDHYFDAMSNLCCSSIF